VNYENLTFIPGKKYLLSFSQGVVKEVKKFKVGMEGIAPSYGCVCM
jgi:hypothetical protein